jgi:DNA-binding response OmpR family regulator
MAYGIVKKHNGYIYVDSEYGKGTTLMVYLPVSREESVKKGSRPAPSRGLSTVLVAEDDNAVRTLIKQAVEKSGYSVITAADGEEAVREFMEHGDEIDLLLFDIVLPKKNGFDAYEQIRKSHPDVKIIFMSGYLPDDARTNEILEKGHTFVSKPIEMRKLVSLVRNTLG